MRVGRRFRTEWLRVERLWRHGGRRCGIRLLGKGIFGRNRAPQHYNHEHAPHSHRNLSLRVDGLNLALLNSASFTPHRSINGTVVGLQARLDILATDGTPGIDAFVAWSPVPIATPPVSELSFHVPQPEALICAV